MGSDAGGGEAKAGAELVRPGAAAMRLAIGISSSPPTSSFHPLVRRMPSSRIHLTLPLGSSKLRLLLCFCIPLTLLLIALGGRSNLACRGASSFPPWEGYNVVINTWKRNDLLKRSVAHYAACAGVDTVQIVWSEPDPPSDSLHDALKRALESNSKGHKGIELRFNLNQEDSLNNRFKEIKDSSSDAVFSVDDDVILPCTAIEFAYSVWRSAPTAIVGFVPRMHWLDKSGDEEHYRYGGWWSVWWTGTYSIILTKAAFLHKQYFSLYTNHMPGYIRDFVTKNRNCEDIAMSFLVANATDAPPIWVKGRIYEVGSTGISSLSGHSSRRSECLNIFAAIYGHMPLVPTSVKAIDSRRSWLW